MIAIKICGAENMNANVNWNVDQLSRAALSTNVMRESIDRLVHDGSFSVCDVRLQTAKANARARTQVHIPKRNRIRFLHNTNGGGGAQLVAAWVPMARVPTLADARQGVPLRPGTFPPFPVLLYRCIHS